MIDERIRVGAVSDFAEDSMTPLEIHGREVLLIVQSGEFYALEDRCTHDNGILHDGELLPGAVKCGRHGAKFDLRTGRPTLPAVKKVRLYDTLVEDGEVFVRYQEA